MMPSFRVRRLDDAFFLFSDLWSASARRRFLSFLSEIRRKKKKESGVEPPHSKGHFPSAAWAAANLSFGVPHPWAWGAERLPLRRLLAALTLVLMPYLALISSRDFVGPLRAGSNSLSIWAIRAAFLTPPSKVGFLKITSQKHWVFESVFVQLRLLREASFLRIASNSSSISSNGTDSRNRTRRNWGLGSVARDWQLGDSPFFRTGVYLDVPVRVAPSREPIPNAVDDFLRCVAGSRFSDRKPKSWPIAQEHDLRKIRMRRVV
jgi:hypothetical protein